VIHAAGESREKKQTKANTPPTSRGVEIRRKRELENE